MITTELLLLSRVSLNMVRLKGCIGELQFKARLAVKGSILGSPQEESPIAPACTSNTSALEMDPSGTRIPSL